MSVKISDSKLQDYRQKMIAVEEEVNRYVIGLNNIIESINHVIFAGEDILLDGLPGIAKTLISMIFAKALGGIMLRFDGRPDFHPNQFMYIAEPDESGKMIFYKTTLLREPTKVVVVLLDEITRFQSRTQAFWFEIMNERKISLPSGSVDIPHKRIFATKNKVTRGETFEIPQPQLDRFAKNVELPRIRGEALEEVIANEVYDRSEKLVLEIEPVVGLNELEAIVDAIQPGIQMSKDMRRYFRDVVDATNFPSDYGIKLDGVANIDDLVDPEQSASGVSPRGGAKWRRIAKVVAFRHGSERLLPEHVLLVAEEVLAHRIFVNPRAASERNRSTLAKDFLRAVLEKIEMPSQ